MPRFNPWWRGCYVAGAAPHERRSRARAGRRAGVPPVSLMLAVLLGGLATLRGTRIGAWVAVLAAALLLALSTPLVSGLLLLSLDAPSRPTGAPPPAAILVLGAETRTGPDGADVGPLTLERLRRAADLQRETGLPLLVTAGVTTPGAPPLAELMRQTLEESFRVPVRWVRAGGAQHRRERYPQRRDPGAGRHRFGAAGHPCLAYAAGAGRSQPRAVSSLGRRRCAPSAFPTAGPTIGCRAPTIWR